ncbi:MAG: PIN domain protein [Candidatus Hydrogenedentes bacterium]|nr:PIN domain protein [Candidatus Hydrogenedentota bacterium]
MRILRIYVDTSVIGGCLDAEFEADSLALLEMARSGRVKLLISNITLRELDDAPQAVQTIFQALPEMCIEEIVSNADTEYLRNRYISHGVVGAASSIDAHHVALAVVHHADMIVSWNFKHIVHHEKIDGFNSVNLAEGYPPLRIYSPKEVV